MNVLIYICTGYESYHQAITELVKVSSTELADPAENAENAKAADTADQVESGDEDTGEPSGAGAAEERDEDRAADEIKEKKDRVFAVNKQLYQDDLYRLLKHVRTHPHPHPLQSPPALQSAEPSEPSGSPHDAATPGASEVGEVGSGMGDRGPEEEAAPTPEQPIKDVSYRVPAYPARSGFHEVHTRRMAYRALSLAADQGNVDSVRMLGDYAFYGYTGREDLSTAAKLYQQASDLSDGQSMFNLGYMHEHGLGLPRDFHLAKRYYDLTLSTAPESLAPVTLALIKLSVHQFLADYLYPPVTVTVDEAERVDGVQLTSPQDEARTEVESLTDTEPAGDGDALTSTEQVVVSLGVIENLWNSYLEWENMLLYGLCVMLGYLVFQRAR